MTTTPANSPSTARSEEEGTRPPKGYFHHFHAEAHVLSGELRRPIEQTIERHLPVALQDYRGGHLTRFTEEVSIEGLISFTRGRTRVSGSESVKHKAWVTLSTSVLEGVNVFEVLTADRVVAQVSTEHPYHDGHVPSVSFLGTKFENLQVSGIPIKMTLNLGVCGDKPQGDQSYLTNSKFLKETLAQVSSIADAAFLPEKVRRLYHDRRIEIENCLNGKGNKITCSLVKSIDIEELKKQIPGADTRGNVLVIPNFGAVSFGEVEVGIESVEPSHEFKRREPMSKNGEPRLSHYFEVTMLHMELGCVGDGTVKGGQSKSNGQTYP